jgi:DNA-binding NarL/FixJ family response regulator
VIFGIGQKTLLLLLGGLTRVRSCPVLVVSRLKGLFPLAKWILRFLRVRDVIGTDFEGKELNALINRVKPILILFDAMFFEEATARKIGLLLKDFPYLNIAVFNLNNIRPEKALYFLLYGAKSYFDLRESGSFWRGFKTVARGRSFVSPEVNRALDNLPDAMPEIKLDATVRQEEVKRFIFRGFKAAEIAKCMGISIKTVEFHKAAIFAQYGVETVLEFYRVCVLSGEINKEILST